STSTLKTSGTMTITVEGKTEPDDFDSDIVLLPPDPWKFTCQNDVFTVINPDGPPFPGMSDEITYTRK
ncbi:MAG: hypothetical protein FWD11_11730, partial [Micrococcales bacterium]|nr:hypothetical protein [Micrococcales bacterium]